MKTLSIIVLELFVLQKQFIFSFDLTRFLMGFITFLDSSSKQLGNKAFIINDKTHQRTISENDEDNMRPTKIAAPKMMKLPLNQEESDYYSSSDEDESRAVSPIQDDTNSKLISSFFFTKYVYFPFVPLQFSCPKWLILCRAVSRKNQIPIFLYSKSIHHVMPIICHSRKLISM